MYKIVRVNDGKTIETKDYKFVVFNKEGRGNEMVDTPQEKSSLIVPPYNMYYTWLTSPIVEVINEFNFKTKNSEYKIEKL